MRSESTESVCCAQLPDGRLLKYIVSGPRDGRPVFYCHGAIGTPLGRSVDVDAIASRLGIRHIAVSRPGIGGSDPAGPRRIAAFGSDVGDLADRLGLAEFDLVGVSAGGPYALAVAHELPERVGRVAVCSSPSHLSLPSRTPGIGRRVRYGMMMLERMPGTCASVGDAMLPAIRRHPDLLMRVIAAHASPAERAQLRGREERRNASESFLDAAVGGVRGMIDDYLACTRDWGFSVADVRTEVDLWHGVDDPLVPVEHALQLALTLPHCRLFLDPSEGHHFFRKKLEEILGRLVGRGTRQAAAG